MAIFTRMEPSSTLGACLRYAFQASASWARSDRARSDAHRCGPVCGRVGGPGALNTPGSRALVVATALAHLGDGRRDAGLSLLTECYRSDPTDHRIAHTLAVMGLWGRIGIGYAGGDDPVPDADGNRSWDLYIGIWASLIADPEFWASFRRDAIDRYQTSVGTDTLDRARARFREWLAGAVLAAAGPEVEVRLAQEIRAADISAVRGGVIWPPSGRRVPCGPLLAAELGVPDQIAWVAGDLAGSADAKDRRAALLFSQIGAAVVLLDRGRVAEAITVAEDLRCDGCARGRPDRSVHAQVCRPRCRRFERANPAYRTAAGRGRFLADAGMVLLEARLRAVTAAIESRDPDVGTAADGLPRALALVRALGCPDELKTYVAGTFLGRVDALRRDGRTDEAIALLGAVPPAPDARSDDTGFGEARRVLAALLAARGVDRANDGDDAGLRDLRRANELHPDSRYVARNLAVVLANVGQVEADDEASLGAAADRLREACGVCRAFLELVPGDREMTGILEQVIAGLGDAQNARAVRAHGRGDHALALKLADDACRLCPDRQLFRDNQRRIRQAARTPGLAEAEARRDLAAMERILGAATRAHPDDTVLLRRLHEVRRVQAVELNAEGVAAADRLEIDKARRLFEGALAKDPSEQTIRANLRQVLLLSRVLEGDDNMLVEPSVPGPRQAPVRLTRWQQWTARLRLFVWEWFW